MNYFRTSLIAIFVFATIDGNCQYRNSQWVLSGQIDPITEIIDFNSGAPVQSIADVYHGVFGMNSSVCNADGNLLLYTNGQQVFNRNYEALSADLTPLANTLQQNTALANSVVILPKPQSDSLFYVFYTIPNNYNYDQQGNAYYDTRLNYSVIDMTLNGGLGEFVADEINIPVINDPLHYGRIAVTKHANGIDWWLVVHESWGNGYYKVLLTSSGIENVSRQEIGSVETISQIGNALFSPDGNVFATRYYNDPFPFNGNFEDGQFHVDVFDFDRCTGEFSALRSFVVDGTEGKYYNSNAIAFSNTGRFIYFDGLDKLSRIDVGKQHLIDLQINSGKIGSEVMYESEGWFPYTMLLAEDERVYVLVDKSKSVFSVVSDPADEVKCIVDSMAIEFDNLVYSSLPIYVNHSLLAEPIFLAEEPGDVTINKGESVQIGTPSVEGLTYTWSPPLYIDDIHSAQPVVNPESTTTYTLMIEDTSANYSCSTRVETVNVYVKLKSEPFDGQIEIIIPTFLTPNLQNDFTFRIINLPQNCQLELFDVSGRIIYRSDNYLNDLDLRNFPSGFYLCRLHIPNGEVMKEKIVIIR